MIRAVLDTNILLSAFIIKIGKPAKVVNSSLSAVLLTSDDIYLN
jgi:predicted nucleic acid-binding protein